MSVALLASAIPAQAQSWGRITAGFSATSGEALSLGDAVCFSGTTLYQADANDSDKQPAVGFCERAVGSGTITGVVMQGTLNGQTGLTAGSTAYLSDTAGSIVQTAVAAYPQVLGIATAATTWQLDVDPFNVSLGAITPTTVTASGLITGNAGITIPAGQNTSLANTVISSATSALDDITIATAKALNIGTEQVIAENNVEGVNARRVARALFTYTDQSGSGAHDTGITIPDNAVITGFGYDVTTTIGGDGDDSSTIAIHVEGANDMVNAVAIQTGTPWDAGMHEGIPQPDDASTWVKTSQARNITVTVAINSTDTALDVGAMVIWVEYIVTQ